MSDIDYRADELANMVIKMNDDCAVLRAENERLRKALIEIDRRDTYSEKSYGQFAEIARAALSRS